MKHLEKRSFQTELRAGDSGRTISGTAITYNSRSQDLGGFVEIVAPGALTKTLRDNTQKLLFNHDTAYVLGSVEAGTLSLTDTATGLQFSSEAPETTWANDLLVSLRRGDIRQCSFGFSVVNDSWTKVDGIMVRTLIEISVSEISIVAFPAYTATEAHVRSAFEHFQSQVNRLQDQSNDASADASSDGTAIQQKLNILRRRLDLIAKG